jgi:hypothetical protein
MGCSEVRPFVHDQATVGQAGPQRRSIGHQPIAAGRDPDHIEGSIVWKAVDRQVSSFIKSLA